MKIMIVSQRCLAQDPPGDPSIDVRFENLLTYKLRGRAQGAVAYRSQDGDETVFIRDGITYYPLNCRMDLGLVLDEWEETRQKLVRAIEDFSPDVIQCMGSEWPYGLISESVSIPVVIHMMGFLNAYNMALDMVLGYSVNTSQSQDDQAPSGFFKRKNAHKRRKDPNPGTSTLRISDLICLRERRIMTAVHYYMGRTGWDRNLVKYYSPGSKYYHVEELLKPRICEAAGTWKYSYKAGKPLRLVTISSADDRKGNEIILRTAHLLKELLGLEFEWRVSGSRGYFDRYEQITGIHHADVNVNLIGYIGVDAVIEELVSADLFIHPSIIDNSSHAVCEAQMIGCPVIVSYVGGNMDLVEDGETGFLYPYNEPHTLAFLIGNLYREEEVLKSVSVNAVRAACSRHDPDRIAQTLYQTYEDIIRDHEKRLSEREDIPDDGQGIEGTEAL